MTDQDRGLIRYIGGAHNRGLLIEDFRTAGVFDQDADVWWTRRNNWTVPREELTDSAYNIAIRPDPEFVLIGGDPAEGARVSSSEPRASEMTPMPPPPEPEVETPAVGYPSGATGVEAEGA